jgi:hypothetical protein
MCNTGSYASNRKEQVAFAIQNLNSDGQFICLEKCMHDDLEEYLKREDQKDKKFKARFYSEHQLKKDTIIKTMRHGQVTVSRLNKAIKGRLKHTKLIWNSCNFYYIAASNDRGRLDSVVALLGPPCIRSEFNYERVPEVL